MRGSKADDKAELARGLGFHTSMIIFDSVSFIRFSFGVCVDGM